MAKLIGMSLIVLCSWMVGREYTASTARRVTSIQSAIDLIGYLSGQLRYLCPPVNQLITQAAGCPQYAGLDYLQWCADRVTEGDPFAQCWQRALQKSQTNLAQDDRRILEELGSILGTSDMDTQLGALQHLRDRLSAKLCEADTNKIKYGNM